MHCYVDERRQCVFCGVKGHGQTCGRPLAVMHHLQSRQHVQAALLQHCQSVVVQEQLSESGEAPEHTGAHRVQLVIAQVQLLHVVQRLKAERTREGRLKGDI